MRVVHLLQHLNTWVFMKAMHRFSSASSSALHLSHWEFTTNVYILVPVLTTFEPSASVSCTVHLVPQPCTYNYRVVDRDNQPQLHRRFGSEL